jgi:hypothetical protein
MQLSEKEQQAIHRYAAFLHNNDIGDAFLGFNYETNPQANVCWKRFVFERQIQHDPSIHQSYMQ